MSIFSWNNTAPTSSPSFSNMNLVGSTSGIQQTSNSSVFGKITSSPFGGTLAFNAATNATSGQTLNVSTGSSTLPIFGNKYDVNSVANEPLVWSRDVNASDFSILGYPRAPAFGKESTRPFLKSSGFENSAFGINQKGSRIASYIATPENEITGPDGGKIQSICGMQTYKDKIQEELRFEDYQLGDKGTLAFNAATNATSGQKQKISLGSSTLQTFGKKYDINSSVANEPLLWSRDANVLDSSAFGSLKATSFGVSSNPHFGTPRFNSYSFGQPAVSMSGSKGKESTIPLLKSSGFGKSAFGINQKGSRTASYIATPYIYCTIPNGAKIQSICGMHTYQDKSQEELRFEDYQLGDKGQQCGSSCGIFGTQGFGVISPVFNQATVDQPFYSLFPSTFAVERAGVDSLSSEISTATASTPFPKSQQSISHIFPPNTSLLNSCGTGSRVESNASDVYFSPWIRSGQFAPLKPASNSSTTSTFSPLRNPWSFSTSAPVSPCSVSPSTYPLLAKPSALVFDQKNSFSPTSVLTTGGAPQSTSCLNCLRQSQPTPPGLCNVSSTPLAASQNTPLFFGPLQPEMTPKVGATLPTTNASHPSTGASCSEIGQGVCQPSINDQQYYFLRIKEVNPSPSMPPAETQPSVPILVEHPNLATSIQYGISSLPVSNNPAPARRRSALIIRHSSLSQRRLPPQKYKPTSDKPKVPFFMDKENASGVLRKEVIIIPRENPRDWVRPTAEFPLGADSSMDRMLDRDKAGDKPKLEPEEMHHVNCGDDKDVDGIMPKLQRANYYTVPPMEELLSKEKKEAGFCCHVKDFVVGRHSIKFLEETDVRKLDLDFAVQFNHREVIIYMDESKKPPVGQGFNKPAEITLLNVRCINKSTGKEYRDGPMVNKYRDILIKKTIEQDAEFVSYDPVEGQWKFRVSHF